MSASVFILSPSDTRQLDTFRRFAPEGIEITWVDSTQPLDRQATQLQDAVAIIAAPSVFPGELARAYPNLRLVQTVSAGTNMLDIVTLGELGIKVAHNGGGDAEAVAEHPIALMVSVYRKLPLSPEID